METFRVQIGVGHPHGGGFLPVSALVSVSATHSMMPESLLAELGLTPSERKRLKTADGNRAEYDVGEARFRVEGKERTCPVIFGHEGKYLVGATTLNSFGLMVDATDDNPRLVPNQELYL